MKVFSKSGLTVLVLVLLVLVVVLAVHNRTSLTRGVNSGISKETPKVLPKIRIGYRLTNLTVSFAAPAMEHN